MEYVEYPYKIYVKKNSFTTRYSRSYRIRIVTVLGQDRLSSKRYKLILDILFRSKDVEKSGTGFQRVNDFCKQQNVTWSYRKEAYGFFFEFIRTNVQINVQINTELTEAEQVIFNLIKNNDGISKAEMAIRIRKSEKTVQRLISSLIKKQIGRAHV